LCEKLERHEIFTAAQQSYRRSALVLFVCLFVYERCMSACAAEEAIGTRAYNTVKRNGGLLRSSGRCWVLFFYFRGKRNLVKLVGLCHNSLCPKCNLVFLFFSFFSFFSAKLVYNLARERKKQQQQQGQGKRGPFFFFFFLVWKRWA
jgi:hypothetical protein